MHQPIQKFQLFVLLFVAFSPATSFAGNGPGNESGKKVKVFILAGQSNMEGKGSMKLAEYQCGDPRFEDFYTHLKKDGQWIVRDDVWINFHDRHGNLTVGYGSPGCIGPELEFGIAMGDYYNGGLGGQPSPKARCPVLLIKTAWGGRSLGRDFLPPHGKMPSEAQFEEIVQKENENAQKRKKEPVTLAEVKARYGQSYREMLAEIKTVLGDLDKRFPAYHGQGYELAGFVWFQGWNDHIDNNFAADYAENLAALIRDVRIDLKTPNLPIVIGQMGQNGFTKAEGGMAKVKDAQASMEKVPEFQGNVKSVATDVFWDPDADKLYPNWRQHKAEWDKVGADHGYHYLGSVRTYCNIGKAFGQAMIEMLKKNGSGA